jgi:hypothetical protein
LYLWTYKSAMNANQENQTLGRLEEQIDWYEKKSAYNQSWYKRIKIIELIAAALIPLLAGFLTSIPYPAIITGSLGALILVLESLQSLYQFQVNWISYRSTCERLRHEKYLWLAKTGHYADSKDPDRLFAERIESLISTEHAKWVSDKEEELPLVRK